MAFTVIFISGYLLKDGALPFPTIYEVIKLLYNFISLKLSNIEEKKKEKNNNNLVYIHKAY